MTDQFDVTMLSSAPLPNGAGDLGIETVDVSKVYRTNTGFLRALKNVSIKAKPNEFVSLVGPSGCGKSTLLRIVAGLIPATTGTIMIGDTTGQRPRRDVALMLPRPALLPWRKIRANVLLPIQIHRRVTTEDIARANQLLAMVSLSRFADNYPRELSDGMQQRVALARVLMTDPHVLLLDEPFGALDEFTKESINLEVAQIVADRRMTTLHVTHNIPEAVFLADRVVVMAGPPGHVVEEVVVPFPRPRSASLMRDSRFQEVTWQVRRNLGLE